MSPIDGKAYAVQDFERARFEYHPEIVDPNHGAGSPILLGLLGRELYLARYPGGSPDGAMVTHPSAAAVGLSACRSSVEP